MVPSHHLKTCFDDTQVWLFQFTIVHFKIILIISVTQTTLTLPLMSPVTLKEMSPQGLKLCRSNFTLVSWKQIKIIKLTKHYFCNS